MKNFKSTILDQVLPNVKKPGQYTGGERNTVIKEHSSVELTFALAFPDTYAIGMSHLGIKILYHMLNSRPDVAAERVFAPWIDMEEELRKRDLPLYSLESFTPIGEFDVIGFSLQYELGFTNVLNMLALAGIPARTSERSLNDPVVIAGGPLSLACEPLAPFLDAVLVGDAEDILDSIVDKLIEWKHAGGLRSALLKSLAELNGVYVPQLYDINYNADGTIAQIHAAHPAPERVRKATIGDFEHAPAPTKPVVPNIEIVHDRINVEIMRGCPNHCRFCQAVQRYRPLKIRSIAKVLELCERTYINTGYDEINLSSLSSADYPQITDLITEVAGAFTPKRVNVSLPSLRVGEELRSIPSLTTSVRKAGFTVAPETGTDRLRRLIRKPVFNDQLLQGCEAAFRAGYRLIKFYYLIGLPGEEEDDLRSLVALSDQSSLLRKKINGRRGMINVAVSSFVPKPHTPFQWEAMNSRQGLRAKQAFILSKKPSSALRFKFHGVDESYLEAVFSRGDRRLSDALLLASKRGIRMDAWRECFNISKWDEVFKDAHIDPDFYALRERQSGEILPWDMIEPHSPKEFLIRERNEGDNKV